MTQQVSPSDFTPGMKVRHERRPEWGIGTISRVEHASNATSQRLTIRFPNIGIKKLVARHAELTVVENGQATASPSRTAASASNGHGRQTSTKTVAKPAASNNAVADLDAPPMDVWRQIDNDDWLSPVARQKVEALMTSLPLDVRDPFNGLARRLRLTLDLYRFDRSSSGLVNWAVAQSGLDDPLSRFTRQELEQLFDRWSTARDQHLKRVLDEARAEPDSVRAAVKDAPPAARQAVQRAIARR